VNWWILAGVVVTPFHEDLNNLRWVALSISIHEGDKATPSRKHGNHILNFLFRVKLRSFCVFHGKPVTTPASLVYKIVE
jgi:hypothetical protein